MDTEFKETATAEMKQILTEMATVLEQAMPHFFLAGEEETQRSQQMELLAKKLKTQLLTGINEQELKELLTEMKSMHIVKSEVEPERVQAMVKNLMIQYPWLLNETIYLEITEAEHMVAKILGKMIGLMSKTKVTETLLMDQIQKEMLGFLPDPSDRLYDVLSTREGELEETLPLKNCILWQVMVEGVEQYLGELNIEEISYMKEMAPTPEIRSTLYDLEIEILDWPMLHPALLAFRQGGMKALLENIGADGLKALTDEEMNQAIQSMKELHVIPNNWTWQKLKYLAKKKPYMIREWLQEEICGTELVAVGKSAERIYQDYLTALMNSPNCPKKTDLMAWNRYYNMARKMAEEYTYNEAIVE